MYPIVLNILIYVFYVCLCYPLSLFIYLFKTYFYTDFTCIYVSYCFEYINSYTYVY